MDYDVIIIGTGFGGTMTGLSSAHAEVEAADRGAEAVEGGRARIRHREGALC